MSPFARRLGGGARSTAVLGVNQANNFCRVGTLPVPTLALSSTQKRIRERPDSPLRMGWGITPPMKSEAQKGCHLYLQVRTNSRTVRLYTWPTQISSLQCQNPFPRFSKLATCDQIRKIFLRIFKLRGREVEPD